MNIIKKDNYYINKKTKKRIRSKKMIKQIKTMRIPPNYKNVKINTNKNAKVLAIGEDSKGRKQYIYNSEFTEQQKKKKFNDLLILGKHIHKINKEIKKNIESDLSIYDKDKIISIVIYIINNCNFRVGNEEYKKKYNTYGTTTLNKKHLIFKKNEIEIRFNGKKNVENICSIKNKNVIKILKELSENRNNNLFEYFSNGKYIPITSMQINSFLKKYDDRLTIKMLRTWNANKLLLKSLVSLDKPKSIKETKKNIVKSNKVVAFKLHNTPIVCKKNYIHNNLCNLYLNNNKLFFEYEKKYNKNYNTFLYKLLKLNI